MPIIDAQDARDLDSHLKSFFDSNPTERPHQLRLLFTEKFDFNTATGKVSLAEASKNVILPSDADRIASIEGINVVYVPLEIPGTTRVRKAEAAATARLIAGQLGDDMLLLISNQQTDGEVSQLHVILPTFAGSTPALRRMVIERDLPRRTVLQQLSNIYHQWQYKGDLRLALEEAFDVEAVTKAFFQQYREVFEDVQGLVKGFPGTDDGHETKKLFVQTLFNRLMFIYFLSRKGWLKFKGDPDYLAALWKDYRKDKDAKDFYGERLKPLFFEGLNNPRSADLATDNPALHARIGDVPFLNGGLFAKEDPDERSDITIHDKAFSSILHDLFDRYNFSVMESTPLDQEVAIDPEMLGKVFEELVTGRHETGSYYTPRPIVFFMCREALKGYLQRAVTSLPTEAIEHFVDQYDVSGLNLTSAEVVRKALTEVKVVDPACGSGAYLLGMMHELVELETALYSEKLVMDPKSLYDLKLRIIEANVYGVDIDRFAVNIARLRLWLSLVIEYEGERPPPLPNLDFKFETGDSLDSPSPQNSVQPGFREKLIESFRDKKGQFMRAYGQEKTMLMAEIETLKADIAEWTRGVRQVSAFDWAVDFAEVFEDTGFDIVLANPPYVRQELISEIKPMLKETYPEVYMGTADLYCYFYTRALQLLRQEGMLVFISSNKWIRANYGKKLRKYIADQCDISSITDFGELPVFEASATFPMIFIAKKRTDTIPEATKCPVFTQVKSLDTPYPDIGALVQQYGIELGKSSIHGENWTLANAEAEQILRKMEQKGISLGEYVKGQIYYGVKTGFNKAFVIDGNIRAELIELDKKSEEIIKPLAIGDDVRKWHIRERDRWLIVTPIGINIKRYPAVFTHLKRWQKEVEARWDQGNHWWELRACDYYDAFDKPKILVPAFAMAPKFCIDYKKMFVNAPCYMVVTDDLYVLGIMNSRLGFMYLQFACTVLGDQDKRGRVVLRPIYFSKLPIPQASKSDRDTISRLVRECLDAKGTDCEDWEREIDRIVARLYGLDK